MKSQTINLKYTLNSAQTFLVVGCSDARVNLFMEEIWKDVIGYEDYYQVSNLGNVKRKSKDKKIKPYKGGKNGAYNHVCICENGNQKSVLLHRIVATAFIPNVENKPQVNHKDGNKKNNAVENLEWVTNKENTIHAFSIGLIKRIKTII